MIIIIVRTIIASTRKMLNQASILTGASQLDYFMIGGKPRPVFIHARKITVHILLINTFNPRTAADVISEGLGLTGLKHQEYISYT